MSYSFSTKFGDNLGRIKRPPYWAKKNNNKKKQEEKKKNILH